MCWSLEDLTLHWKSNQRQEPLLVPRVLQGWETKGRWCKGLADPLNPHVQHGRACILCQLRGAAVSLRLLAFPPSVSPECTALPVWESVFILVLVFWYRSRMLEKPGNVGYLTTASITTQYVCPDAVHMGSQHTTDALNHLLEPNVVGHSTKTKKFVPDSHDGGEKLKYRL